MEQSEVRWAKPFEPHARSYNPRIPNETWENYKDKLTDYHKQGLPRKEMLTRLRDEDDFAPSKQQLDKRMVSWGLTVYPSRAAGGDSHLYAQDSTTPTSLHSTSDRSYRRWADSETASRRSASPARSPYRSPYNESSNRSPDTLDRDDAQSTHSALSSRVNTPLDRTRSKSEFAGFTSHRAASLAPTYVQRLCVEADAHLPTPRNRSRAPSPTSSYGGDRETDYATRSRHLSNDYQPGADRRSDHTERRYDSKHDDDRSMISDQRSTRASTSSNKYTSRDITLRDPSPHRSSSRPASTRSIASRVKDYPRQASKPPSCSGSWKSHESRSSDTSSFMRLAIRLKDAPTIHHQTRTWSTTMSICSDESWRFETVTGYPSVTVRPSYASSRKSDNMEYEVKVPGGRVRVSRGTKAS